MTIPPHVIDFLEQFRNNQEEQQNSQIQIEILDPEVKDSDEPKEKRYRGDGESDS